MSDMIIFEETVGEDGKLVLHIPPEGPHGRVKVTVEPVTASANSEPEDPNDPWYDEQLEKLLTPENLKGQGLTMGEILQSPEIGAWKHRTDITDSVEFVEKMRRERQARLFKRD
jgi:hypothetical protein